MKFLILTALLFITIKPAISQVNEGETGAWYMYFFDYRYKDSKWGMQGDVQYRNWNYGGDLEQLLLRGGFTYRPSNARVKFTLGYGNITTGAFGDDKATTSESRIYQEAIFPVKFGDRFYTNHRFRYEQRFVENQNFRTRYRYNFFMNIALNKKEMEKGTVYLGLYNELFINGQRNIGNGVDVDIFDRNRFYSAIGYVIKPGMKVQLGLMRQTTNSWSKNQLQVSFHHSF